MRWRATGPTADCWRSPGEPVSWLGGTASAGLFRQMRLSQPKDGHEGVVDAPLLLRAHIAHKLTKPSGVDGADLLNQDAGGLPEQVNLRPERRGPNAARRWWHGSATPAPGPR